MTILFVVIIFAIAGTIYFWDDFKTWEEKIKKFWKEIPVLFDRNIISRPKKEKIDKTAEIKKQYQAIIDSHAKELRETKIYRDTRKASVDMRKPKGYGSDLEEKLTRVQQQIDARKSGKLKSIMGQRITDWERRFLWDGISKRKRVPCIHCEMEDMYKGPSDGPSQTWRCPHCGQGIKLSFYANTMAGFQCDNLGINQDWIK